MEGKKVLRKGGEKRCRKKRCPRKGVREKVARKGGERKGGNTNGKGGRKRFQKVAITPFEISIAIYFHCTL
jgi:hypothetical protein